MHLWDSRVSQVSLSTEISVEFVSLNLKECVRGVNEVKVFDFGYVHSIQVDNLSTQIQSWRGYTVDVLGIGIREPRMPVV
jgi:hypothetical protein